MSGPRSGGRAPVIVVGLDGATFERLDPLMQAGVMPGFARLVREGARGELESVLPPVTAPAWASFMTGRSPARHGVFDFVHQDRSSYRFRPVDGRDVHAPSLWRILSEHDRRVVVMNVPVTWPPEPGLNGVLISDFLLARGQGPFSSPPGALAELEARHGPYPTEVVPPVFLLSGRIADARAYLESYRNALSYKFAAAARLLHDTAADFLMLHVFGNDQISHWLWEVLDPAHPRHTPERAARLREHLLDYYRTLDTEVMRLFEEAGDGATLLVVSDHGFGPVHRFIDLNVWLLQRGYLTLRRGAGTRLKRALWRAGVTPRALAESRVTLPLRRLGGHVAARVARPERSRPRAHATAADRLQRVHRAGHALLSFHDVDWARTRAFAPFGFGQIRIHTRGEWTHGCVEPGAEAEALRAEIAAGLRALRDGGRQLEGVRVLTRNEAYGEAAAAGAAPDVLVIPTAGIYQPKSVGFYSNSVIGEVRGMTGIHKLNGVLLAAGAGIARGRRIEGARLVDLCPTILHLLGVAPPEGMDGRVLGELLDENCAALSAGSAGRRGALERAGDAARAGGRGGDGPTDRGATTGEGAGDEAVLERLRRLGYLQ